MSDNPKLKEERSKRREKTKVTKNKSKPRENEKVN